MPQLDKHFENILNSGKVVTFSCRCEIGYKGRAESFLPLGDRLVIVKSDGTLLIHQPTGNRPINYMKPGTTFLINDNKLICTNLKDKETLTIQVEQLYHVHHQDLEDGQTLQLRGTEKHMSDALFNQPHLIEEGFKPYSREEHTKYGFIDVYGIDKRGLVTVVECKRYKAGPDAVQQLRRYVEKVKNDKGLQKVRGILAAPSLTKSAQDMINHFGYTHIEAKPPKSYEAFKKDQKDLKGFF